MTTTTPDLGGNGDGARGDVVRDRAMFVDPEWFAKELEHVFAHSWLLIGHDSEVPNAGDYVTRRMGTDPVILVRDESGDLYVLLNSCQHRGTQLCKASFGNTAHFRCGYHGWLYGNDGRLKGVPSVKKVYADEYFAKEDCTLPRARVALYHGLVYATWDEQLAPFEDSLGDLRWYLDALFDIAPGGWEVFGPPARYLMQGNWKLPVDNLGMDGYHLATAHKTMYEAGFLGRASTTESVVQGHTMATPEANTLRVVHPILDADDPLYFGFPEDRWPSITEGLTADQREFLDSSAVVHGQVFPNSGYIKVALFTSGDPRDKQTAFLQWRLYNPIDVNTTEGVHWCLVPRDYPDEWKRESYKFATRTHSGGAVFEGDDLENFSRIQHVSVGTRTRRTPWNLSIGLGVEAEDHMKRWPGPGPVEPKNYNEAGNRALYSRLRTMVEAGA
jgi:phenylpropionate dioxygenase-like ring-hydroxylating dioxygenase large terminal subunit